MLLKVLNPGDIFRLTKAVWTQDDFEQKGWHDATVHAITFDPEKYEFILDLDYILAWVNPKPPSPGYSFWVSPATLVFQNVTTFHAEIDGPPGLEILDLDRADPRPPLNVEYIALKSEWTWTIELTLSDAGIAMGQQFPDL